MRKLVLLTVVSMLLALLAAPAGANNKKVDICHKTGNGSYDLISVSAEAVAMHIDNHGDALVGDPVPDMDGYVFDENCAPLLVDADLDGVLDADDNCPLVPNADQSDRYGSDKGDVCEDDSNGDGVLDVDEPHICVHIDGVEVIRNGSADCFSNLSTGSEPNIAVSHGQNSFARASDGDNNTATANSLESFADAGSGDNNTATATGEDSFARAGAGDNNTATAIGLESFASASQGDNNTANANGEDSFAIATAPAGCTASAIGDFATDECP